MRDGKYGFEGEATAAKTAASELTDAIKHIRELQRMLGKKAMENEILREAVEYGRSKNGLRARPRCQGKTSETGL